MPISDDHKLVYVHIPRTAGTALNHALRKNGVAFNRLNKADPKNSPEPGQQWLNHLKAGTIANILGEKLWAQYFKFAVVRNPWDRMVSHYYYHLRRLEDVKFRRDNPKVVRVFEQGKAFADWVFCEDYVEPQINYLRGEQRPLLMDLIGRFEELPLLYAMLGARLGLPTPMQKMNASSRAFGYRQYYVHDTQQRIAEKFKEDITLWGYQF